jgi:hypothetical protein
MVLYRKMASLPQLLGVASAMTLVGCASDRLDGNKMEVLDAEYRVMPFEQYRDRALRVIDGERFYQVEFDLFFDSEDDLYQYYVQRVEQELDKSTALVDMSTGKRATWVRNGNALNIRYCVSSNDFGEDHAAVVADVSEAMHDWEDVANLHYVYVPAQDGNCYGANADVDVAIVASPAPQAACGMPPYVPSGFIRMMCPLHNLGMLSFDYARWPWERFPPPMTPVGVFRHELGHINGFRHEQVRAADPACAEAPVMCDGADCQGAEYLTEYDVESVMQYPGCGITVTTYEISKLDGIGARMLYGMPAAWYVPVVAAL